MKKTLPLLLTFFVGVVGAMGIFVPAAGMTKLSSTLGDFGIIIAGVAFVLGGINIVQVNIPIVARRRPAGRTRREAAVSQTSTSLNSISSDLC